MDINLQYILDRYKKGVNKDIRYAKFISDSYQLELPFWYKDGDQVVVYVYRNGNKIRLGDDGRTYFRLTTMGYPLAKTQSTILPFAAQMGLEFHNQDLEIEATEDNFNDRLHQLVQAMLIIGQIDMIESTLASRNDLPTI